MDNLFGTPKILTHTQDKCPVYEIRCLIDNCNYKLYIWFDTDKDAESIFDPRYLPHYTQWFNYKLRNHWRKRHGKELASRTPVGSSRS